MTTASSFSVPYTSFEVLSPGPHNFTRTFSCGRNATRFFLPGTHAIVLNVGRHPKVNCTYSELSLLVSGGGKLSPVEGAFINVTLSAVINGERVVLDAVKAPINVSELAITGTPVTTVTVGASGESVVLAFPKMSYEVNGVRGYLVVYVGRPSKDEAEVAVFLAKPMYLPINVSKIMIKVGSNMRGEFRASLKLNYVCVITKYLDTPQYVPRISYASAGVTDKYLDLGNLPTALVLMVVGLALMSVACYLRAMSARITVHVPPS